MFYTKDIFESEEIVDVKYMILDTFSDPRGEIWPIYSADNNFLPSFVEDKITFSRQGVLRGLHGDSEIGKLITCIGGRFQLAVADLRANSPTYGKKQVWILDESRPASIYVPPGCVNGHLCLSSRCAFHYKWTKSYNGAEKQITIRWDDPSLAIHWESQNPTLSERDTNGINSTGIFL